MNAVEKGERLPYSKEVERDAPAGFVNLIEACWDGDSKARPIFRNVLFRIQDMEASLIQEEQERSRRPLDTFRDFSTESETSVDHLRGKSHVAIELSGMNKSEPDLDL